MPSDQRQAMRNLSGTQHQQQQQQHPVEPENLPCPRCDSINTKFCYYNNYNLSQPRYFCKSCRRYWTRGGTLRNVPVGGGSRKNSKRSRSSTSSSSSSSTSAVVPVVPPQQKPPENDVMMIKAEANINLNEASFTSLLTANPAALLNGGGGGGLGYGLELGFGQSGFEDMGLGFGYGGPSTDTGSCWQVDGGMEGTTNTTGNANDGGGINVNVMDGGDYFGWPELAISTAPEKGLE